MGACNPVRAVCVLAVSWTMKVGQVTMNIRTCGVIDNLNCVHLCT